MKQLQSFWCILRKHLFNPFWSAQDQHSEKLKGTFQRKLNTLIMCTKEKKAMIDHFKNIVCKYCRCGADDKDYIILLGV
jgi:hypothetical protein